MDTIKNYCNAIDRVEEFEVAHKYMLVNTAKYDGCEMNGKSSIFLFNTSEEAFELGVSEDFESLEIGERIDCEDYDGAFVIRLA